MRIQTFIRCRHRRMKYLVHHQAVMEIRAATFIEVVIRRTLVLMIVAWKRAEIVEHRAMHNRNAKKLQAVYRGHQAGVTTKLKFVV